MRVWVWDNELRHAVDANLMPMTDEHVAKLNATWVPEFHRRQESGVRDQDFLMWETGVKYMDLLTRRINVNTYVVVRSSNVQGVLVLAKTPETSRLHENEHVLIVHYLATAPWNRRGRVSSGRYRGTGTVLLGHAVLDSMAAGCLGRLGLHSLTDSDDYYRAMGFDDLGLNPAERGLRYFELSVSDAARLLCATINPLESAPPDLFLNESTD